MGTGKAPQRTPQGGVPTDPDWVTDLIASQMAPRQLAAMAPRILEKAEKVRTGMLAKAKKEGMALGPEEEEQVRMDILKESLVRELVLSCHALASERAKARSTDGGLLALPAGYQGPGGLDYLDSETVKDLMEKGYAVQQDWLGQVAQRALLEELEMLDAENRMEEAHSQRIAGQRWAKVAWQDVSDLNRLKQPRLRQLFEKTISVPFELNKKCGNLLLQASGMFEVACYGQDGFYRAHMDGSRDPEQENGRKISMAYFPAAGWRTKDEGTVRLWGRQTTSLHADDLGPPVFERKPGGDVLLLWMSRDIPMEIQAVAKKLFVVGFWSNGPDVAGKDAS